MRNWSLFALGLFIVCRPLYAMSLNEYLDLVKNESPQIQLAHEQLRAAENQKAQPQLSFSPQLIGGLNYMDEKSLGTSGIQQPGDRNRILSQNLGIQKEWTSGTKTSLQHLIRRNDLEGIPGLTDAFWTNQIQIQIEQDVWRNFFGQERRNELKSNLLALDAAIARARFTIQSELATAQKIYWQLALAQRISKSLEQSLSRTRGIFDYNQKRFRANIIDKGDLLQSEAAVLQLQQALEDSRAREQEALRHLYLYVSSSEAAQFSTEDLVFSLDQVAVPENWSPQSRLDLRSLELLAEAEAAEARAKISRSYPDLRVSGSYSGNSFDASFGEAEKEVFKDDFRRYELGLQLKVPLQFSKLADTRAAAKHEASSAEIQYRIGRRELEIGFSNLKGQITETLNKLDFAMRLEKTQREKLANEDKRYRQGRSSSFQLLTFEEDLAAAELEALTLFARLRSLLADLQLFQESKG